MPEKKTITLDEIYEKIENTSEDKNTSTVEKTSHNKEPLTDISKENDHQKMLEGVYDKKDVSLHEDHDSFIERIEDGIKKTNSTKLWTILNTFIGLVNTAFLIYIFATLMLTPM